MVTNRNRASVIPAAIQTLLDEYTHLLQWLAKLDEVLSEFRPAVTARVRLDYKERLRRLESKLRAHAVELETLLVDHLDRLDELAAEYDAALMDLEEAQLRHALGEYPRSEWENSRTEYESMLEDLNERLEETRMAVDVLEGMLSKLTGRMGSLVPIQTQPAVYQADAADDGPAVPVESVPVVTGSVARRNQGDDISLGELEFLEDLSLEDSPSF